MSDDDTNQKDGGAGKGTADKPAAMPRRSGFGRGGDKSLARETSAPEKVAPPAPAAPYFPPTDATRPAPGGDGERPRRFERTSGERVANRSERSEPASRERTSSRPAYRGRDDDGRAKRAYTPKPDRPRAARPPDEKPTPTPRVPGADEPERIAKVMARAGIASRRDSEAMILEGRVTVNGTVIDSPALDVTAKDRITVDGEMLPDRERTRLWLYHKPRGLVTTARDTEGRTTVFESLPEDLPRVIAVGRLDINTEGLLLLTNDGGLARVLELPRTGWLRRYRVRAFGEIDQARLDTLRDGITIDGEHYGPITARFEREQGANTWLTVDLREGKNREVKRVLEHLGLIVNRLIRVSFGPFQLGDLPEGEVDEVRMRVIKDQLGPELAAEAGVDFDSIRRDEGPVPPPDAPRLRRDPDSDRPRPDRPRQDRPREDRPREERPREERPRGDKRPDRLRPDKRFEKPERGPREERAEGRDKPWTKVVWRDPEVDALIPKSGGGPRRGADPKTERATRAAAGTSSRSREAAVADPKGRRIKVERVTSTRAPDAGKPSGRDMPVRKLGRAKREDFLDENGTRKATAPHGSDVRRRPRDDADREPRGERPTALPGERPHRNERPFRARSGDDRPTRSFERGEGKTGGASDRKPRSFKPREDGGFPDRPRGERPRQDRSRQDRPREDSPREDRPQRARSFGDKPGDRSKSGGVKSGGGRSGGGSDRSGGERSFGERGAGRTGAGRAGAGRAGADKPSSGKPGFGKSGPDRGGERSGAGRAGAGRGGPGRGGPGKGGPRTGSPGRGGGSGGSRGPGRGPRA
jgi:23S rRNA pseudouridine2605 synthase